ncbi:MAG TPA: class I mannose-6-phosphate isomerase [Sphingomicrobium sp.]
MKLDRRYVEKPWGRTDLPPMFDAPPGKRIGEVWFTGGAEEPLLVKYLFTSEPLSIQVHPNDEQARARGFAHGKSECWTILDAEPGATLGLGLKRPTSDQELRAAALDGSIEHLMSWRPVRTRDFFMVPSGTIHAIGAGISLLEFQQNSDLTYRLYDFGRPRELHIDAAVAVASREPYAEALRQQVSSDEERILVDGPDFILIHASRDALSDRLRWVMPLEGTAQSTREIAGPGECLLVKPDETVAVDGRVLIGAKA